MGNNSIIVRVQSESIYLHSIATLSFFSRDAFTIDMPLKLDIIHLAKGKRIDPRNRRSEVNVLQAEKENNNNYVIEFSVIGLFNERVAEWNNKELGNHYGMRFYPFVSSIIRGTFFCSNRIESISIVLPNVFRFIFAKSSISQNNCPSVLRHSYGEEYSTYIFTWDKEMKTTGDYQLFADIPVRLGGRSLLRIVRFPIYYWIGALIAVALLTFTDNIYVVIGAVAAAWVFMLERWDSSSLPQSDTILTRFYLLFGALLGLWGVVWSLYGLWGLIMAIPLLVLVIIVLCAENHFNETGELPQGFARAYARMVIKKDRKREMMTGIN